MYDEAADKGEGPRSLAAHFGYIENAELGKNWNVGAKIKRVFKKTALTR